MKIEGQARWKDFQPKGCTVASSLCVCSYYYRDFCKKLMTQIIPHGDSLADMENDLHSKFYEVRLKVPWRSVQSEFPINGSEQHSICAVPTGEQCRATFNACYGSDAELQLVILSRHEMC